MFLRFDNDNLVFKNDYRIIKLTIIICTIMSAASYFIGRHYAYKGIVEMEGKVYIKSSGEEFSKAALVKMLKDLDVKFPYIVMSQSLVETGGWKSLVFRENHNLFGMKEANVRIKTSLGTQLNHAYYDNWKESVYDYAFYQSRYLSSLRTESEYYAALDETYAEASHYSTSLKKVVEDYHLKELFK
jgi:uncharacterized FlgJ-related protein